MEADYAACEARLLVHEGGYTNDPRDPGGPTNWGITIYDARKYWKPNANAEDVRNMPKSVALQIYHSSAYWTSPSIRGPDLVSGVDDCIFDYGVNSGVGRSGKVLRQVLGMPTNTSIITDQVITELKKRDPVKVINAISDERLAFLESLSTWSRFGGGWGTRVSEVRAYALVLASGKTPPVPQPSPVVLGAGKGQHPAPTNVAGGGIIFATAVGTIHGWVNGHPAEAIMAVAAITAGALALDNYVHSRFTANQQALTPGIVPIPAAT